MNTHLCVQFARGVYARQGVNPWALSFVCYCVCGSAQVQNRKTFPSNWVHSPAPLSTDCLFGSRPRNTIAELCNRTMNDYVNERPCLSFCILILKIALWVCCMAALLNAAMLFSQVLKWIKVICFLYPHWQSADSIKYIQRNYAQRWCGGIQISWMLWVTVSEVRDPHWPMSLEWW